MADKEGLNWETIAKALAGVLCSMILFWMGWVSLELVELSDKSAMDRKQWQLIQKHGEAIARIETKLAMKHED